MMVNERKLQVVASFITVAATQGLHQLTAIIDAIRDLRERTEPTLYCAVLVLLQGLGLGF
jgi:hypothetical protein